MIIVRELEGKVFTRCEILVIKNPVSRFLKLEITKVKIWLENIGIWLVCFLCGERIGNHWKKGNRKI